MREHLVNYYGIWFYFTGEAENRFSDEGLASTLGPYFFACEHIGMQTNVSKASACSTEHSNHLRGV